MCNWKWINVLTISRWSWWCAWFFWIQNKWNFTNHSTRYHKCTHVVIIFLLIVALEEFTNKIINELSYWSDTICHNVKCTEIIFTIFTPGKFCKLFYHLCTVTFEFIWKDSTSSSFKNSKFREYEIFNVIYCEFRIWTFCLW